MARDSVSSPSQTGPLTKREGKQATARPTKNPRAVMVALSLVFVALLMCGRSLTYSAWYQNRRCARMGLEELRSETQRHKGEPIPLYYFGKALNGRGRYSEALPALEQAAGLDPDDARIREEWSTAQLAGGYVTGAFGQLTQFVRTHPDSAAGHTALGRFYIAQGSYIRATEELGHAVQIDPRSADGWSLLAGARMQMGGLVLARDAAKRAVDLRPDRAVDHMLLASLLLSTNDSAGARREYATAASLAPNETAYQSEYARVLLKSGDARDAAQSESIARKALAKNPGDINLLNVLGMALMQQNRYHEAIEPLRLAATILPPGAPHSTLAANSPDQFLAPKPAQQLATAYRMAGDVREAERWQRMFVRRQATVEEERKLSDAIRMNPGLTEARRAMARLDARRGDVEGVAKNLAKAMASAPDAPAVLVESAKMLTEAGHGALAAPLAHRAAMFSKASPAAFEAWGDALLAKGQPHEAAVKYAKAAGWWEAKSPEYRERIATYYRSLRAHPTAGSNLYERALALESAPLVPPHSKSEVKTLLAQAIALEPENTDYRRYLLKVLFSRREHDEAVKVARDLLAISPEDGRTHALLAIMLLEKSANEADLAEAETHLKDAETDGCAAATLHYGQGVLAIRRGRSADSVRLLRLAVNEDPTAETGYYQLAQAERMAGHQSEAGAASATYASIAARRHREAELLGQIQAAPSDRRAYIDAARFYSSCGMKGKAALVTEEMRRRCPVAHS